MKISDEEKLKISILLAEYNTLRAEAVARAGYLVPLIAFTGASITFVVGAFIIWLSNINSMSPPVIYVAPAVLFVVVLVMVAAVKIVSMMQKRDLEKAVTRVAEIELDINERVGEDLLIWENLCGGRVTSYWDRDAACLPRTALKNKVRPVRSKNNGDSFIWIPEPAL
jgi:hypothetical protein